MITVGMNYKLIPGKEQIFENAFKGVLGAMEETGGHQNSNLYKNVGNAQDYVIISEWNDRGAFDSFIQSDKFRQVANWGKEQILAGRPKHEIYEK